MLVSLLILAGLAAVVIHGAVYRNSAVFGRVTGRVATKEKRVALTFDDGPNPAATSSILATLRAERVPATFFLLGRHVERWPELARQIVADGHAVGNHGYYHRRLHLRSPAYARLDLQLGTHTIAHATGAPPTLFRAPHGFRNPWVNAIAHDLGQRVIGWTLGVWDSDRPGPDAIVRRAVDGCRPGTILLLHDGDGYDPVGDRSQTAAALPGIIRELRERGYQFVRLPS